MSIWKLFGGEPPAAEASADTDTVRRIVARLDAMDPMEARYLAAFAYILGRVADADLEITDEETLAMERIVMRIGSVPEDQAVLIVQMAKTQNALFGGTENFLVTREFVKISTHEQRIQLLQCLFAVSAADDTISSVEDHQIRRIAEELKIEHRDYIQARLAYKEHLSVLRQDPA